MRDFFPVFAGRDHAGRSVRHRDDDRPARSGLARQNLDHTAVVGEPERDRRFGVFRRQVFEDVTALGTGGLLLRCRRKTDGCY